MSLGDCYLITHPHFSLLSFFLPSFLELKNYFDSPTTAAVEARAPPSSQLPVPTSSLPLTPPSPRSTLFISVDSFLPSSSSSFSFSFIFFHFFYFYFLFCSFIHFFLSSVLSFHLRCFEFDVLKDKRKKGKYACTSMYSRHFLRFFK